MSWIRFAPLSAATMIDIVASAAACSSIAFESEHPAVLNIGSR